jgi:aminoglycoside 3-N-acetyltransferase
VSEVTQQDIVRGLKALNVSPPRVAVHSSLRSFGRVQGGTPAVIGALTECFQTVLMPAFQYAANVPPPMDPPPQRNGCDYRIHFDHVNPPRPFRPDEAPISPAMGTIARTFAQRPDVKRSTHPWHSWAAWGEQSADLVANHAWTETNPPLERLAALGGWVLLMGVSLKSCTAVHTAEERSGRRPFIRWAMNGGGEIREVRVAGCSKGFDRLASCCEDLFRRTQIGRCQVQAAPLTPLIERLARVLREQPDIVRCSDTCLRCRDSALGGPIEKLA